MKKQTFLLIIALSVFFNSCSKGDSSIEKDMNNRVPSTVLGLRATPVGENQIDLSWTAATDDVGVDHYKIYRNDTYIASVSETTYSDDDLAAATKYWYKVSAVDGDANEGPKSTVVSVTTLGLPVGELLWDGSPSAVPSVTQLIPGEEFGPFAGIEFEDNEKSPGKTSTNGSFIKAMNDENEGKVWHFHKVEGDRRVEAKGAQGLTIRQGKTYYVGFRFKVDKLYPSPDLRSYFTLFQWKAYPNDIQNYPFLIAMNNGKFTVNHFPNEVWGDQVKLFQQTVEANKWYQVVLKIQVADSPTGGDFQIWFGDDETPETLLTGGTSYKCDTWDGDTIHPKWGYYKESKLPDDIYFSNIKIGTAYGSVVPAK